MVDPEFQYNQALDYLYSFVDYSLTRNLAYSPEKFDLGRMVRLMDILGNPQNNYPIIHVAGTKGKGSVSAFIASALKSANHRVGFYCSPHLQDFAERIQVNGAPIKHSEIAAYVEKIKPAVSGIGQLTTFEITTALGFLYFSEQNVDVAVIEVGLGGRLDATNIVDPLVSVITSLSMDHMNVLGDTLTKIAGEKAGIIKDGKPVVLSTQKEEARIVIERIASERNAPIYEIGKDWLHAPLTHSLDNQQIILWEPGDQINLNEYLESDGNTDWRPMELTIPLLGNHQVENAATSFLALKVAEKKGLSLTDQAIKDGFASVFWPGRFEILSRSPILIIDSAHNPDSAVKLRLTLDDYFPGKPVILIFGASEDKDVDGMFVELLPRVNILIATQSIHPRAMDANKLVELAHHHGCKARAILPVRAAIEAALKINKDEEHVILAAGSLFIAAAVRDEWQKIQSDLLTA